MGEDVKQFLRSISDPDLPCELKEVMWVEPVENTRSRDLILKNLQKTIEATKDKQSRVDLCGIILGFKPLANTKPCSREVIEQLEKFPLEDEQRSAALMALLPVDDNEPTLLTTVRGGPSTGKTYLSSVVCKVALASKLNPRILVCAPTNISLEALIEAMAEFVEIKSRRGDVVYLQSRIPSTRMEHDYKNEIVAAIVAKTKLAKQREAWMEDHINDRLTPRYAECTNKKLEGPLREVEELIEKKIRSNTLLAFTTLESALKVPLSFGATMLVIEEAARAIEPQALILITRFSRTLERILLVGDTRHLLPFSLTDYSVAELSFLERLMRLEWNRFASLRQQREIHPAISEAIRKIWYRDNSKDPESLFPGDIAFHTQDTPEENSYIICDHLRVHSLPRDGFYRQIVKRSFDINDLGFWIDIKGNDNDAECGSKSNIKEVDAIRRMCCVLSKVGIPLQDIAILTPYASQRELLTDDLQDQIENGLSVSSFEEYQLHRDVVLVSLVRANEADNVGFLNNRNRLCASFIHARYVQIIFGNHDFMTSVVTGLIRGNNERAMKDLVKRPYKWRVLRDSSKRLYERYIKMADF
ncbi:DNA-binding protein SMUBP-2 [Orbilia oligospora]|uniref:DNA-binding protein SMUBP-2 n=1 Tax=Orbilia oligospora TaxID=2813651 RepID=A0A7C8J7Z2_ORBOL|nr:DNA-binding protein SMUBP-2 [Orbilia oligospora]KAF3106684.1 DNA-binding protein SMUBP-2 [Orbilia oligospora]